MLPNDAAEHVYDLLGILLLNCDHAGTIPIIGGDFNAKRCSACCPKKRGQYNLRTSDQLLTFVDNTKHLHIFYSDDSNISWKQDSRKNSIGFGQDDGRRLEERLVTANLMLDKTDAVGIISLDLSKAFDRVHWPALWRALVDEGIPDHLARSFGTMW